MSHDQISGQTAENFNRAKKRAAFGEIFSLLNPEKNHLLSFHDIRELIKPKAEFYRGLKTVPLDRIVGSEGRYHDFNRTFLPRREHLRLRWQSIDEAALQDKILPPIKLFQIGDIYFVRDGNHRVSVARTRGQIDIDAEITELTTEIPLEPNLKISQVRNKVIAFELNRIIERAGLGDSVDFDRIRFTTPGRYEEILRHILGHRDYLQRKGEKVSIKKAARSWFESIYLPAVAIIKRRNLVDRFPGRTEADLYVWAIKHWNALREDEEPSLAEMVTPPKKPCGLGGILCRWGRLLKGRWFPRGGPGDRGFA